MKQGMIHRNGQPIVACAWRADRPWSRLRGLLGRKPLSGHASQALWLVPCGSVHTFGMGYPLDVVFLDRAGRVLGCRENLRPWRAQGCRGAHQTVELAPGGIAKLHPETGEVWQWASA